MARLAQDTEVDTLELRPTIVTAPSADALWPGRAASNAEVTDHPEHPAKPCEMLLDGGMMVQAPGMKRGASR